MRPGPWKYDWVHVNESMSIYMRMREEPTVDGMAKPFVESLAYMQKIQDVEHGGFTFRALVPKDVEFVEEMDIPYSKQAMKMMQDVEQHFNTQP